MALLGWLFVGWLLRPYLPANQIDSYIAGLILLAAAPCTAMVFVWSNLSGGEPHFTLSQVALNDLIMVFAFAPIVGLLLGLSAISVPWETLVSLRRAVHRGAGPAGAIGPPLCLARGALTQILRRCNRFRCSPCSRPWCFCSASKGNRF